MHWFKRILAILFAWLATALGAAVLGTVFQSFVLGFRMPVKVGLGDMMGQAGYDIMHFMPFYLLFVAAGLAVAFLVASILRQLLKWQRRAVGDWLFVGSGLVAMAVMLWAMENAMFGLPLVSGARTSSGVFLQMLAGGLAGGIFAFLTRGGNLRRSD